MKKKNKIDNYKYGSFVYDRRINKFDLGGDTTALASAEGRIEVGNSGTGQSWFNNNSGNISGALNTGAGLIGSFDNGERASVGAGIGKGALSGAAAGASFGPWGAAIGGVVGGAVGGITSGIKRGKQERAAQVRKVLYKNNYKDVYNSQLDIDNENSTGYQSFALGGIISEGDPIVNKKKTPYDPTKQPTYDPTLLTNGKFLVTKADGSIGQWGNDPNIIQSMLPTIPNIPRILPSNKALGTDNTYTPSRDHRQSTKDVTTIKPSWRYEEGSDVQSNIINIEKGELLIDPEKGVIKQEYNGINPLTGGLFQPHAKKDKDESPNNITKAGEGDFIITTKKAKVYKDAVDNNDSISKDTILMNIRNHKIEKQGGLQKYAQGSDVRSNDLQYANGTNNIDYGIPDVFGVNQNTSIPLNRDVITPNVVQPIATSTTNNSGNNVGNVANSVLDNISKYGPAITNIGQGLFGKTFETPYQNVLANPYMNKILANMPHDINTNSITNEIYNNQKGAVDDLRNNTNSSAIYRANRANIGINTNKAITQAKLQAQVQNNQIAGQRAQTYGQLGQDIIAQQDRARQLNLGIDERNNQAKVAQQNMFNTGISQLQQIGQNDKTNNQKRNMDKYNLQLLAQIFPNLKNYSQFDANTILDQLNKKN